MKRLLIFLWTGIFLLSACGTAGEEGTGVETHDPWARAALKDGTSAVYFLLHNHSTQADALVGTSSDVATTTEIDLSQTNANGVVEMIPQDSIALPEDAEVEVKPGGYHIMLIGLKKDLNAGDKFSLTLHFKHHEDIIMTVPVLDVASSDSSSMDMEMHTTPTP